MKTPLKYLFIVIGLLLLVVALLLASCFIFEEKLLSKGKSLLSENLGTEIQAEKMDIQPLGNFPYITLSANDLSIEGSNGNPLVQTKTLEMLINPLSLLSDDLSLEQLVVSDGKIVLLKENDKWNFDFGSQEGTKSKGIKLPNITFQDISLLVNDIQAETNADILLKYFEGSIELGNTFSVIGEMAVVPKQIATKDELIEMKSDLDLKMNILSGKDDQGNLMPLGIIETKGEFLELDFNMDAQRIKCEGSVEAQFLDVFNLGFEFLDGTIDVNEVSILRQAEKENPLEGSLRLRNLDFVYGDDEVTVNAKRLKFNNHKLETDELRLEMGDSEMDFQGALERNQTGYSFDGKLSSRKIDLEDILSMMQDSSEGSVTMEGALNLEIDKLEYGKWTAKDVSGKVNMSEANLKYDLGMKTFRGDLKTEGDINYDERIRLDSKLSFSEIETEDILDQLDNLGQGMITSDNLSGELSGHALLDFYLNQDNSIDENKSSAKIALDFQEGRLTDFKMLEDFSKHIDVDDLMNVKFDRLSNILEWKGDFLAIPLMFINNNAANFTISGHHDMNNKYIYNLQVNASDILARKFGKKKSSSRRKGWWNMYYVIQGEGDVVSTVSDKSLVQSNFKRSKNQKRLIFNELLKEFGNTEVLQDINDWSLSPDQ